MILFISVVFSGLVAGLFYSYSCSVNPAFGTLTDSEYIIVMQAINKAIQNPYFFISFIGLLVAYPIAVYSLYSPPTITSFYALLGAAVIYFIGVFGITLFCNVPLNEQLADFQILTASQHEISAMRKAFEEPWNRYHAIRTLAAILAFCLSVLALLKQKA